MAKPETALSHRAFRNADATACEEDGSSLLHTKGVQMENLKGGNDLAHERRGRGTVQFGSKLRERLTAYVASAVHRAPEILTAAAVGAAALAGQGAEAGIIIN